MNAMIYFSYSFANRLHIKVEQTLCCFLECRMLYLLMTLPAIKYKNINCFKCRDSNNFLDGLVESSYYFSLSTSKLKLLAY